MHDVLTSYGYPALFLLSLLAATLIPLGSEWLIVTMILQQYNPATVVLVATAGNCIGAFTSYLLGIFGSNFLTCRILRMDQESTERAKRYLLKYGSWSLLFTWVPVIGDPLCLVGGMMRMPFGRFSVLVAAGKGSRYAVVAWLALHGAKFIAT